MTAQRSSAGIMAIMPTVGFIRSIWTIILIYNIFWNNNVIVWKPPAVYKIQEMGSKLLQFRPNPSQTRVKFSPQIPSALSEHFGHYFGHLIDWIKLCKLGHIDILRIKM